MGRPPCVNSTLDIECMLSQVYERLAFCRGFGLGFENHSDLNQIVTALLVDEGELSFEYRDRSEFRAGWSIGSSGAGSRCCSAICVSKARRAASI